MGTIAQETEAIIKQMLETFLRNNKLYGENYTALGDIMVALFPNGIHLNTADDFIRFHFLDWSVGKLTRYVRTGMTHEDSSLDLAVYAAMLTAQTKVLNND